MDAVKLLATVPQSTAAFISSLRSAGPGAPIPTCGEWRSEDLAHHLAVVYAWVAGIASGDPTRRRPKGDVTPPLDGSLDSVMAASQEVIQNLEHLGPDGQAWNYAGQPEVGAFWYRRMAHESAMHAIDAQLAAGETPAMDPELAADGIDELLTVIGPHRWAGIESIGSLHVHCTDTEGEWLVDPSTGEVRREHAKGDAALRGPALDLLLRLYNRGDDGEVVGDAGVMDRWAQSVRF